MTQRVLRPAALALLYVCLACVVTWPLATQLGTALPGFPNIDSWDTLTLRGVARGWLAHPGDWPHSDAVYWPAGYDMGYLMPNLGDHAVGGLLSWILPFPLSDNVFWLGCLVLMGASAHHLGKQLGGTDGWGVLLGVAWVCSDAVLRELNLSHAPQSMTWWAPLYFAALHRLAGPEGRWRDGVVAGVTMGLAGLCYWYLALFMALGSLAFVPLLRSRDAWLRLGAAAGVAAVLAGPGLAPMLLGWEELPLTGDSVVLPFDERPGLEPIPEALRFVFEQGAGVGFAFDGSSLDLSNRVSWVLLVGVTGLAVWQRAELRRTLPWLGLAALAAVMVLGPYLKWGADPVLVAGRPVSLPFRWLGALHPFLERLTWPQRWGLLIPLGLGASAACLGRSLPRWVPWSAAALVLVEAVALSPNLPTQTQDLRDMTAWRALEHTDGAVLELPLGRPGLHAPLVGVHQRFHNRPLVNPILLPPGRQPAHAWHVWMQEQPLIEWIDGIGRARGKVEGPLPQDAVQRAADAGLGAVALDAMPGSVLSRSTIERTIRSLSSELGPGTDYGSVVVWWLRSPTAPVPAPLEDGPAWRKQADARLTTTPKPDLNTLIDPIWNARLGAALED